jgi:hypothetical protein
MGGIPSTLIKRVVKKVPKLVRGHNQVLVRNHITLVLVIAMREVVARIGDTLRECTRLARQSTGCVFANTPHDRVNPLAHRKAIPKLDSRLQRLFVIRCDGLRNCVRDSLADPLIRDGINVGAADLDAMKRLKGLCERQECQLDGHRRAEVDALHQFVDRAELAGSIEPRTQDAGKALLDRGERQEHLRVPDISIPSIGLSEEGQHRWWWWSLRIRRALLRKF